MKTLTTLTILTLGSALMAGAVVKTPEIDPVSGMSALTLVAGAVMVFRNRRGK